MALPLCPICGKPQLDEELLLPVESEMSRVLIATILDTASRNPGLDVEMVMETIVSCGVKELKVKDFPTSVKDVLTFHRLMDGLVILQEITARRMVPSQVRRVDRTSLLGSHHSSAGALIKRRRARTTRRKFIPPKNKMLPIQLNLATVSCHAATGLGGLLLFCGAFYFGGFYWRLGARHADQK